VVIRETVIAFFFYHTWVMWHRKGQLSKGLRNCFWMQVEKIEKMVLHKITFCDS